MSVGGRLIEIRDITRGDGADDIVTRLWCVDRDGSEVCVYVERAAEMPAINEQVWWQGGKVFFAGDTKYLRKIGFSFTPPGNAKPIKGLG